jgi:hypothetical protein
VRTYGLINGVLPCRLMESFTDMKTKKRYHWVHILGLGDVCYPSNEITITHFVYSRREKCRQYQHQPELEE